jgi:hypothetical protein
MLKFSYIYVLYTFNFVYNQGSELRVRFLKRGSKTNTKFRPCRLTSLGSAIRTYPQSAPGDNRINQFLSIHSPARAGTRRLEHYRTRRHRLWNLFLARRKNPLGGSQGGPSCDSDRRDAILERAPSGVLFV